MAVIPEVTCRRCRRKYSSLRSKCPYCGTRKEAQSSRAPETTAAAQEGTPARARSDSNTMWQMVFGGILTVAVVVAVIVLVSFGIKDKTPEVVETPPITSETPIPTPTVTPPPTPVPTIEVTGVNISFFSTPCTDIMISIDEALTLTATVFPVEAEAKPVWSSSDEAIFTVTPVENSEQTTAEVEQATITGVSGGTANLYVDCGPVRATCIVRVRTG